MKLTDKQLEKLLLKAFEELDKTKESCKVTVSQCLQSPDPQLTNSVIKACLETMDTVELCKMFVINRSPNIKNCISFTLKVLKTNMNECKKKGCSLCRGIHELNKKDGLVKTGNHVDVTVPSLQDGDIRPCRAGVRAQALERNGKRIDDFRIERRANSIHVLNAPSPAATAGLAIGDHVNELATKHFKL